MKSEAEIREFFERELRPDLDAWEMRRIRLVALLFRPRNFVILAAAIAGSVLTGGIATPLFLWAAISAIAVPFVTAWFRYSADYKHDIVRRVIRFYDPSFRYDPESHLHERWFRRSRLFRGSGGDLVKEDHVRGKVGDTRFQFCEIIPRDSEGNADVTRSALFFAADFAKRFQGTTLVLPDRAERQLGELGRALQQLASRETRQLVELEDPEFERYFAVYSDDQIEARYVLSTSLMRRILAFRSRATAGFRMSFAASRLYMVIPMGRDLFEPGLTRDLASFGAIRAFLDDLELAVGIVEELNLNTRIWARTA